MMYKCTNCVWEGEETVGPLSYCPICGDVTKVGGESEKPVPKNKAKDKGVMDKIKEMTEDLLDDGKRNYSNNPKKKSPGRKKKK